MEPGPTFMKLRMFAFCCIMLASLVWLILLNLDLFLRWDVSDPAQRSFVIVFILIDALTVVMLPVLLIVEFRAWLESARMLALVLAHFSAAISYTVVDQKFECPHSTPDDDGVCELIDLYILLASWVIPALLLAYMGGFGTLIYRRRKLHFPQDKAHKLDIEMPTLTVAEIPIMPPPRTSISTRISASTASRYSSTTDRHMSYKSTVHPGWLNEDPAALNPGSSTAVHVTTHEQESSTTLADFDSEPPSKKSRSSRSSARLSKRLPEMLFS
ncbi:hypothetical protein BDY19DRAFT_917465 [Irpex rosettiformis]|uniref:Uncharacterized protein n=1 Tax=Irpex rosettiformis TaxID=378272 RepID=A0ACB8UGQ5_9APHY|nr:hypothetical protein BDY19DRAFT_917465 [Irpex rosettiformis]